MKPLACSATRLPIAPSILAIALAAMLSACGSGKTDTHSAATDASPVKDATVPTGDASAAEVAAEKRGGVDCPASPSAAVAGTPVDDVLGVRPGMSWDDATRTVFCSNPLLVISDENQRGFDFPTFGQTIRQGFSARFAEPRVQRSGRQVAQDMEREAEARMMNASNQDMKPGQVKWFVATMGMPGQEKVISAAREEWFDTGRNPTLDSVQHALEAKYGPVARHYGGTNYRILIWMYDPRGRPVTETSPLYQKCTGIADPDDGMHVSADCGVMVQARLTSERDNPALAQNMQVGVVDQAAAYAALNDTQDGLAAQDAQKRAKQVQDASKNAQAPSL